MKEWKGDWWPDRDEVCWRVSYNFEGADKAIKKCKKLDLVIQAGGNVGVWPKYLRQSFKTVWTFEPSPENWELMTKNIHGLDIQAVQAALGIREGRCSIKENPANCGDDQTVPGKDVRVVAIDDLNLEPDLIYLDIQGDEILALQGAVKTIERCSPVVVIEWDRKMLRHGDAAPFLEALGYQYVDKQGQDRIYTRD